MSFADFVDPFAAIYIALFCGGAALVGASIGKARSRQFLIGAALCAVASAVVARLVFSFSGVPAWRLEGLPEVVLTACYYIGFAAIFATFGLIGAAFTSRKNLALWVGGLLTVALAATGGMVMFVGGCFIYGLCP